MVHSWELKIISLRSNTDTELREPIRPIPNSDAGGEVGGRLAPAVVRVDASMQE